MIFGLLSKTIHGRLLSITAKFAWVCVFLLAAECSQAQSFSAEYDALFQKYTARYLYGLVPDNDWRWFKAQCIQESRLRPYAVSPAGAGGLCQLVDGAAYDAGITSQERFEPEKNIKAGAFILRRNIRAWWVRDTKYQRLQLGQAGYNAGAGNIIKAQARCDNGRNWPDIAPCLWQVTGYKNSSETINYVIFIKQWFRILTMDDN